jgi:hypothetical protein
MAKYYVKVDGENNNTASLKAKYDIEEILSKIEYKELYNNSNKSKIRNLIKDTFKIIFEKDLIIISQYPFYKRKQFILFRIMKKFKRIKLISIIHDINSLRGLAVGKNAKIREINFMNSNDYIISHNSKMTQWLKDNRVKVPIINLEIFDYLNNEINEEKIINDFKNIYFAGNLHNYKSKFIYTNEMSMFKLKISLYGPNYDDTLVKSNNIVYKGSFLPNELGKQFGEGFGLIWDGTTVNKCDGINGEYLKYNNPHKASLYLSSGLPVIIWNKAALADFVKKYKVGFVVGSLKEIEYIIDNMTVKEYKEFKNNVMIIRDKLSIGEFTINAVKKCENNFREDCV